MYKRQVHQRPFDHVQRAAAVGLDQLPHLFGVFADVGVDACLLYTSDAADERSSVDLGGRRIIKKKTQIDPTTSTQHKTTLKKKRE